MTLSLFQGHCRDVDFRIPGRQQDAAGLAYIAQDIRPIATRVNIDRARIVGMDGEGEIRLTSSWTAVNYRLYGSGLDAPGFNLPVQTRYRF